MNNIRKHSSAARELTMRIASFLLAAALFTLSAAAQRDSLPGKARIAVFSPLYLDSAFDASGNYRYGKTLPRHISAGLEFYEGIELAIDSLAKEKIPLDVYIYDTRSKKKLDEILRQEEMAGMDLFIGYVNVNEAAQSARAAAEMNIPFVNTNLPNDAGIRENPNYVIMNPTLGTHCHGIYKFIQKNYPLATITYFRKKGPGDDMLRRHFTEAEKTTASVPLKIRYVTFDDTVAVEQLAKFLDSSKQNVCIAGSLDPNFGLTITRQLSSLSKTYKSAIIGMPTWDQMDLNKSGYRGIEIIYSSPLYINNDNQLVQQLQHHFKTKYFSRTAESVYTGFECLFHFARLLAAPGSNSLVNKIAGKKNTLFGEFDIQPVVNKQTGEPDYYENKKLYFIKKLDGIVKGIY